MELKYFIKLLTEIKHLKRHYPTVYDGKFMIGYDSNWIEADIESIIENELEYGIIIVPYYEDIGGFGRAPQEVYCKEHISVDHISTVKIYENE